MAFSIIVPSMVNWTDLKKVVVVKKIHSIPRESFSLFLPFSVMYMSACTTNTNTNETCASSGPGERCCSTVFDIREKLLEERWPQGGGGIE